VNNELELYVAIVEFGTGSRIVKCGKSLGLLGGFILLGKGTVRPGILSLLGLDEIRKEIIIMGGPKETVDHAMKTIGDKFNMAKPGRGIAMSIPITGIMGGPNGALINQNTDKGGKDSMYNLIYAIVDMGKADDVVEAAKRGGSTGATIMTGRGTGEHEKLEKVFAMEIEPQKEIVLILSNAGKVASITDSIRQSLDIDDPGHGVIFTVNINEVHGLYSDQK